MDDAKNMNEEVINEMNNSANTDASNQQTDNGASDMQTVNDEYKDKYLRLLAEFQNYQRQKEEELRSMAKFGARNVLLKVVDIVDDIETGLQQENLTEEAKGILEILHSKMIHMMTLEGITEIQVKAGDAFDMHTCEVLSTIEDEANKGKISQVVRKGYMISDRVLRSAKVIVGK